MNATLTALDAFVNTPLDKQLARHLECPPEQAIVAWFRKAAPTIPAYIRLLAEQGLNVADVNDIQGFRRLPLTDKQNYVLAAPLPERCLAGRLPPETQLAVSTGSTGKPAMWPRSIAHELDVATRFEQVFCHAFQAHERPTLAIVCFALGNWVGGMYSAQCVRLLALKGHPIALATPGNQHDEIFRIVEELGSMFEQIVLLGYPPFIKDILDEGKKRGINWPRYRPKLMFAGETFSETWRDIVCDLIGSGDPCHDTASLYGTADGGVLGNETPLSIAIRRFLSQRPQLAERIFGEARLPTLVQYDPISRFFEVTEDGTLAISGDNGMPLLRYHIADKGGIHNYAELLKQLTSAGFDAAAAQGSQPDAATNRSERSQLPFVHLFGRANFTVSYYGANVYPENVQAGLQTAALRNRLSGKFVMHVRETDSGDKELCIVIESPMAADEDPTLAVDCASTILAELLRQNSEYRHYVPAARQLPHIELRPNGDPNWFPSGIKHRYTRAG